jgi:hypothetical protein
LTRKAAEKIYFGRFNSKNFDSLPKCDLRSGSLGEMPPLSTEFDDYLTLVQKTIDLKELQPSTESYKFFEVENNAFDKKRFNIEYYDCDLREEINWLEKEKWVTLESVAEIYVPKSTQTPSHILSPKHFDYPLSNQIPISKHGTNIILQKGDVLISSIGLDKAYLVYEQPKVKDLSPLLTYYVIRSKSELVTPYYLFLYLQSRTFQKYAKRFLSGTILQRASIRDVKDFPVVLPDKKTQEYSKDIFEKLFLETARNQIDLINDLLFSKKDIPDKQVQKEFVLEKLDNVRLYKRELISRLVTDDFSEISRCLTVSAYKSTLILSGSILEAFLLDWLSDIDQKNYFEVKREPKLSELIERLTSQLGDAKEGALRINNKRNLVHPKRILQSQEKIVEKICLDVIKDLREVIKRRDLEPIPRPQTFI